MQIRRFLKLFLLTIVLIVSKSATSQNTFNGIFFQAIARDNFSNPAKDRIIHIQSTIIQTTLSGTKVLVEEHKSQTDGSGVFSISIGQGTRIGGTASNLSAIEWAKGPYFLNLQIAIEPIVPSLSWDYKKEWVDLGTTPFGTVPYALYSGSSGALDDKLSIADTAKMLAIYAKAQVVNNLSTQVNSKLSAADTTTMLAPYAKMVNALVASNITSLTAATVNAALDSKVNVADSGSKYVTPLQLKGVSFDTAGLITKINKKVNLADSTTVFVTPLQLAAKTFDSTAIYTQLALKLNKTDTSALLRKSDTTTLSNRINLKVNNSDVIDVAHGGTGLTTIGTNGQLLTSNGSILSWTNPSAMGLTAINGLTAGTQTLTVGNLGTAPNFVSSGSTHTLNIPMASSTGVTKGLISNIDYTNFSNKIDASQKGVANGIASLDVNSKVPASQIPVVSFQSANVVSSQSAMLALSTAVIGSIAIRTDVNENFVLSASDPSVLSNWVRLAIPTSVTSVNGYAGPTVSLTTADIAPSSNRNYITTTQLGVLSNTSGINTGDQTITLTGDVTGIGTGIFVTTVNSIGGVSSSTIASLPTSIAANTSSITSNTNSIAILNTNVSTNTASITAEITRAINAESALDTRVASNTASITSNTNSIATLNTNVSANTASITSETTRATNAENTLDTRVASNTAIITSNTNSIATLNTNVSTNTASITAETTRATNAESVLDTRVTSNTSSITSNTNSIATLNTNVSTNTASITAETTRATNAESALDTRVASNTASITSNTNSIATLNTNMNANTSSITTNISDITSLTSRVNTATSSITSNTADIATLNTSLSNKANLNSPTFTGTPSLPSGTTGITQTTGDNSNKLATTAFVAASITASSAGLSSVGPISGTSNANGATISGSIQLILTPADATNGGIVSNGTQSIAGYKTFESNINVKGEIRSAGTVAIRNDGSGPTWQGVVIGVGKGGTGLTSPGASGNVLTSNGTSWTSAPPAAVNAGTLTGTTLASNITNSSLTSLGTITSGTWSGTTIGSNVGGAGTVNGLLKANGSGVVSAAVEGTDFQAPLTTTQVGVLSNTSGTNTGDQTITLTGDVTGIGTGTFTTTLTNSGVIAGSYGSNTSIPTFTVDAKGRLTSAGTITSTAVPYTGATQAVNLGAYDLTVNGLTVGTGINGGAVSNTNTALGTSALAGNNSGSGANTAIGSYALKTNTTGSNNTGVGYYALQALTTATDNTALGAYALRAGSNGYFNTSIGSKSMFSATSGANNTAVGVNALYGITTAGNNTAMGFLSLNNLTTGDKNIALGYKSGSGVTSGTSNIMIGSNTGSYSMTTGSYNTIIGTDITGLPSTLSNNIILADGAGNIRAQHNGTTGWALGTITSGTWSGTSIAIANGGTGATTASGARTNLGLGSIATKTTIADADIDASAAIAFSKLNISKADITGLGVQENLTAGSGISINAGTISATGLTTNNIASNAAIANSQLAYSATTLGSTTMTLGGTVSSVVGLNSISANTIIGTLSGTANSATNLVGGTVGALPYQSATGITNLLSAGTDGQVLTMSSGVPAWITNSSSGGINSIGAISGTSNANGATISGSTQLILTPADANFGGIVTTATQTFAGAKTFTNTTTFNKDVLINGSTVGSGNFSDNSNTALGSMALSLNTSGTGNVAIGKQALTKLTATNNNTAIGQYASYYSTGTSNTAIGNQALYGVSGSTTGSSNVAIGASAMQGATIAGNNVSIGGASLGNNANGHNNVVMGYSSGQLYGTTTGVNLTKIDQSVLIGAYARAGSNSSTNEIVIGYNVIGKGTNTVTIGTASNTANYFTGDINLTGNVSGGIWSGTTISVTKGGTGLTSPGASGNVLTSDGTNWISSAAASGVNTLTYNTVTSTSYANGGTISGTTLYLGDANASNPGLVSTGTQTFVGSKTFSGTTIFNSDISVNGLTVGKGGNSIVSNTAFGLTSLNSSFIGTNNVGIGYKSLQAANNSGNNLTAVGASSGYYNSTGTDNSFFGYYAGFHNTTGLYNTAIGSMSIGYGTTTGYSNTAVGYGTLYKLTGGYGNSAIGDSVLNSNTDGYFNVGVGHQTLNSNLTGYNNIGLGYIALGLNTSGISNIGIGRAAIYNNQTGKYNIGIGEGALEFLSGSTNNNIAIGYNAGGKTSGNASATGIAGNVLIGYDVRVNSTTDVNQIVIAGNTNASPFVSVSGLGSNSTLIGNTSTQQSQIYGALTVVPNTASGAGYSSTIAAQNGGTNFAGGGLTLRAGNGNGTGNGGDINLYPGTTGTGTAGKVIVNGGDMTVNSITVGLGKNNISTNTALGSSALAGNNSGSGANTAIGYQALLGNTSGSGNVALGYGSLATNTTSSDNTAVGTFALNAATGSSSAGNVAIGAAALQNGMYIAYNTAIGKGALNLANGTSSTATTYNTAVGYNALNKNTTGTNNLALGAGALFNITTASNNTAVGLDAGSYNLSAVINSTGTNGIFLGYKAQPSANALTDEIVIGASTVGKGSNTVTIGNNSNTKNYLTGDLILGGTGNITSGVWSATAISVAKGGTGLTSVGTNGQVLSSDGTNMVWSNAGSGVSTLTYTTSSSYANGGTISGTSLTLSAADATNPGLVSLGAQTIVGAKTFSNTATFNSDISIAGNITSGVWSGTAISVAKGGTGLTSSGNNGNILASDGTNWVSSALSTTYTSTSSINGGTFSGTTLTLTAADATNPGLVSVGAQAIVGAKTFSNTATFNSDISIAGNITSGVWSGTAITVTKGGTGLTSAGSNGSILTSDGTNWVSSALSTTYTSTASTNGGTFSGTTLTLTAADVTKPGLLTASLQIIGGAKTFSSTVTATGALASGTIFSPTLVAAANNDVLAGIDINPNFTNGSFTSVANYGLRVQGIGIGVGGGDAINNVTNTAVGNSALLKNTTTGIWNTGVGYKALLNNLSGSGNTAFGYQSLYNNNSVTYTTALGYNTGNPVSSSYVLTKGIYLGANALPKASSSTTNEIVIGSDLYGNGSNTTTIGNTSTQQSQIYGALTIVPNVAAASTHGASSTISAQSASTSLFNGGALNLNAGNGLTSGIGGDINLNAGDSYFGAGGNINLNAGTSNYTGTISEIITNADLKLNGITAGRGKGNSTNNTIFGNAAFGSNTTGTNNAAFGTTSLYANTTGNLNTAVGSFALSSLRGTYHNNTAIGATAIQNMMAGGDNVALGYNAAGVAADGTSQVTYSIQGVFIGSNSKPGTSSSTNEIVIGYNAKGQGDNTTTIGNSSTTNTYIPGSLTMGISSGVKSGEITINPQNTQYEGGQINIIKAPALGSAGSNWTIDQYGTTASDARIRIFPGGDETIGLLMKESGNIGMGVAPTNMTYKLNVGGDINAYGGVVRAAGTQLTSDLRLKNNILPLNNSMNVLNLLRPVSYDKKYNLLDSVYHKQEFGFIAQEVQKVLPQLVTEGKDKDKLLSMDYISIIPLLTKAMQEQDAIIKDAQKENKQLKEQLNQQQKRIDAIELALKKINLKNN